MKNKSTAPRGYLYLKLFIAFVILLVFFVGVLRGFSLYTSRSFTGNSYITLYSDGESNYIVSYHSPSSYSSIKLRNEPFFSTEEYSNAQLSLALGVPIDAVVVDKNLGGEQDIFSFMNAIRMLAFPGTYTLRDINGVDGLKYFWLKLRVDDESQTNELVDYESLDEEEFAQYFLDEDIFNSGVSVEVMNGTQESGLGSLFASALSNRGHNVIAVTNTDAVRKKSFVSINRAKDTESVRSLMRIFDGKVRNEELSQTADVVVVLGQDILR